MGALGQQTARTQQSAPGASLGSGLTGMLGQFLDADKDGSIADDVLGIASRMFNK
jgi:hypothetical protein